MSRSAEQKPPARLRILPDDPLVSVVIPCYNQGHFLSEAIESALGQTYPRFEVLVVDDGSSDGTANVAASYGRVRFVRQENRGVAEARNRGFQETAGECVVFLDADDRLRPRALEAGLKTLRGHPDVAFSYGWSDLVDAGGKFLASSRRYIVEGDPYAALLRRNVMPNPAAMMFRREALEAAGTFRTGVDGVEDYELCLRLTRLFGVSGHREVVADYRQHGASLSRRVAAMSDAMLRVLEFQAPHVSGCLERERALREGMTRWRRVYYAEALLMRARDHARAGRWHLLARDAVSLLLANPAMILENALRKVRTTMAKTGRT